MALEKLSRRAQVDEESRKYYIRQRKLKLWRKAGRPVQQEQFFAADRFGLSRMEKLGTMEPVKVRVRCSGALHAVTIEPCGRLHFHAHTKKELDALRTLRGLGDESCGCLTLIKRIREAPKWRGPWAVLHRTTQRTLELRKKVQWDLRPGGLRTPTREERLAAIRNRITSTLEYNLRYDNSGMYADIPREMRFYGVADAKHAPGVYVEVRHRFTGTGGWQESGKPEMTVVVPFDWALRLDDRPQTGVIDGFIVFAMRKEKATRGFATVAVRTGLKTFELQEHEVVRRPGEPWRFVVQPTWKR